MQRVTTLTTCLIFIALTASGVVATPQIVESAPTGRIDESSTPLGKPAQTESEPIGDRSGGGAGVMRTFGALGVVVGLALAGWLGLRVLAKAQGGLASTLGPGGRAPSGLLEVLGRYPVGRGQTLVLLRVDRRVLLLSQAACGRFGASSTFTTLSEITNAEDVASILVKTRDEESSSSSTRFSAMLGRFEQDYEPPYDAGGRDIPVVDLTGEDDGPSAVLARIRRRIGAAKGGIA